MRSEASLTGPHIVEFRPRLLVGVAVEQVLRQYRGRLQDFRAVAVFGGSLPHGCSSRTAGTAKPSAMRTHACRVCRHAWEREGHRGEDADPHGGKLADTIREAVGLTRRVDSRRRPWSKSARCQRSGGIQAQLPPTETFRAQRLTTRLLVNLARSGPFPT